MNVTLYTAAADLRGLLDQMDPETGEMPDGFEAAREVVERKAVGVVAYILESDKQADMLEAHAKEVMERVKAQRNRNKRLREYLAHHMAASGVLSIKDERGLFSAKLEHERDESVEVFDAAMVPADYMREKVTREPDKTLIKRAIGDGFDVPGARIAKKDRLTIK